MFRKRLVPIFTLFAAAIFAQETQDAAGARTDYGGAERDTGGQEIKLSVNYKLSTLNLSLKYLQTGSILIWRDVYMHGAQANAELDTFLFGFDTARIGAGFSGSARGYFTDDDATNDVSSIGVMSSEITSLELGCDLFMNDEMFSPGLRMDFNWLKIENYDLKTLGDKYGSSITGLINTYNMYKLGFSGGIRAQFAASNGFYADLYGYAGLGIYLGIANWIHNKAFQQPVSFSDIGGLFRGGTEFEFGFKTGSLTFFTKLQLLYEISPGVTGINIQYLTDGIGRQAVFTDIFSSSYGVGVKAGF